MKEYYLKINAYITVHAKDIDEAIDYIEKTCPDLEVRNVDIIDINSEHYDYESFRENL